ncbi:hypothetical protein J5N97_010203 [Dioscorea zingiberensis]|uniref:YABBY protein C-terminal domain-containing protein n=1 Tax=Dioscorea zingiberensis TaxID=325984 RepID=A0A9D5HMH2_9LILI|nr:hypothetical protein J5N97_010203 [Dioscorea zingiberensis]
MAAPEKKHRLPSAYNRFMKEEIQRIKAAKPDIPHREAFSMAAKNWAKCDPRTSTAANADKDGPVRVLGHQNEKGNGFILENFNAFKQLEHKN